MKPEMFGSRGLVTMLRYSGLHSEIAGLVLAFALKACSFVDLLKALRLRGIHTAAVAESAQAGLALAVALNLVLALYYMPVLLRVRMGIAVHQTFPGHVLDLNLKPERVILGSEFGAV